MPFEKGHKHSPGRTKGVGNKTTNKLRSFLMDFAEMNKEKMQEDLDKLEPKDRLNTMLNLFEYCLPKLQRTELVSDDGNGFTLKVVTYKDDGNSNDNDT